MKIKLKTWLILLLIVALPASAASKSKLPEYAVQFIDVDTGRGIAGGWVGFQWFGKADRRHIVHCERGVVGRTDSTGWFRNTAVKPYWQLHDLDSYFLAGYEQVGYQIDFTGQHTKYIDYSIVKWLYLTIPMDINELGKFPPWEAQLKADGYTWSQPEWRKKVSVASLGGYDPDPMHEMPIQLLFKRWPLGASFPGRESMHPVNQLCKEPDSDNIGFDQPENSQAQQMRQRGLTSLKNLCNPAWDRVPATTLAQTKWDIRRVQWLAPDQIAFQEQVRNVIPSFSPVLMDLGDTSRPFTKFERETFCALAHTLVKPGELQ